MCRQTLWSHHRVTESASFTEIRLKSQSDEIRFATCILIRDRSDVSGEWSHASTSGQVAHSGCVSDQPSCTAAAALQMDQLCPMSAPRPEPGPLVLKQMVTTTTQKKKKNSKVANYFSSGQRKQLTTGVMCWLKSSLVSMSGGKAPSFSARLAGEDPPLPKCWPWPELSCGPAGMG